MDLCGPMRVQTINGKIYILVIVDDYSRFTWVKFFGSKDETPEIVIKFLKQIQVGLNKTVRYIFLRTPQQNDIVERRNRTFVEAARTMLIFSKAQMVLWAEAVATACYIQDRSLIHTRHNKTPYELVHDNKPDLKFLRVFGALCYPTNDSEDLRKLRPTADIGIFVGVAPNRKGYRIYNKRTQRIMEIIHIQFDELTEPMAHVHISTGLEPILLMPGQISSGLVPDPVLAAPYVPPTNKDLNILFQPMFDEYFKPQVLKGRSFLLLQFKFQLFQPLDPLSNSSNSFRKNAHPRQLGPSTGVPHLAQRGEESGTGTRILSSRSPIEQHSLVYNLPQVEHSLIA
ncbi:retrovirus-related pol polyprotein from transposon TNT 1-94 [Tanacetum coccineum]